MEKIVGIILMGGEGARFGSFMPKQFHLIEGKEIYLHTLETFVKSHLFDEIILVCHCDWLSLVQEKTTHYPVRICQGGKTRQRSSYLGLLACPKDTSYVVIHDAVRPFVSYEILKRNVERVKIVKAIDTCIPLADTIVHSKDGLTIDHIPLRHEYFRGQTPQSFEYSLILKAHENTQKTNASDDCSLVLDLGHSVEIVRGDERNRKITTELDVHITSAYLKSV